MNIKRTAKQFGTAGLIGLAGLLNGCQTASDYRQGGDYAVSDKEQKERMLTQEDIKNLENLPERRIKYLFKYKYKDLACTEVQYDEITRILSERDIKIFPFTKKFSELSLSEKARIYEDAHVRGICVDFFDE